MRRLEDRVRTNIVKSITLACGLLFVLAGADRLLEARTARDAYPAMAPKSEIALARSAAPRSIEDPGSPVMAATDAQARVTILFVRADKWSDGTAAPPMKL
jgi:hypothetical protein